MIKNSKKHGVGKVFKRRPWQRMPESLKFRIACEVLRGEITLRAACTKYSIHSTMLYAAIHKVQVNKLINEAPLRIKRDVNLGMNQMQLERSSAQEIKALTEELKRTKLKIEGLETMIDVAEDKFKIKIRKKAGTKQSRGCGKDIQE